MLFLGVLLIVGGCLSSALGLALMKRSGEVEAGRPLYLAWRWLLGFGCLAVLQTACDALSLSYLPLSVVAPFAGLTIVFSLAIASSGCCGDGERLNCIDLLGAAAVLVGVTCVASAAPQGSEPSLANMNMALAPAALIGVVAAAASCLGGSLLGFRVPVTLCACGAAACGAASQLALKLVSLSVRDCLISASQSDGSSGGLISLIVDPVAIAGACGLAFSAPSQLALLNLALSARASLVVPIYQASLVSLTTLAGGAAFHEFEAMQASSFRLYGIGMLAATAGLLILSRGGEGGGDDKGETSDEDEDGIALPEAVLSPAAVPASSSAPSVWLREPLLTAGTRVDSPEGSALRELLASSYASSPYEDEVEAEDSLDARLAHFDSPDGRSSTLGSPDGPLSVTTACESGALRTDSGPGGVSPSSAPSTGPRSDPRHNRSDPRPKRRSVEVHLGAPGRTSLARVPAPFAMGLGVATLVTRERTKERRMRTRALSAVVIDTSGAAAGGGAALSPLRETPMHRGPRQRSASTLN